MKKTSLQYSKPHPSTVFNIKEEGSEVVCLTGGAGGGYN